MEIGKRLKVLRLKKGVTQECLAELFCVSPQAVSRWENNGAYPDITLLPGLALYFDTTVDTILGMDEMRNNDIKNQIHGKVHRLVSDGKIEQAAIFLREQMKIYPMDIGLRIALTETLSHLGPEHCIEAISISEWILNNPEATMKEKGSVATNLFFLYLKSSQKEKAASFVRSLPHLWESREFLLPELQAGEDYKKELKHCGLQIISLLYDKIKNAQNRSYDIVPEYIQLGMDGENPEDLEKMLQAIWDFLKS